MPAFALIPILLALSSNPAGVTLLLDAAASGARAFPMLDAEAACRDVSRMDLNKIDNTRCLADERKARETLKSVWASFPETAREQCLLLAEPPALPSYVTLQESLNTKRDAAKLSKGRPDTGVPGAPGLR
jgi:hypothetical protein